MTRHQTGAPDHRRPRGGRGQPVGQVVRQVAGLAIVVALLTLVVGACSRDAAAPTSAGGDGASGVPATNAEASSSPATRGTTKPGHPGTTTGSAGTALPPPFTPEPVTWKACAPKGYECGTVTVPLDHDHPEGAQIDLAVKRKPAAKQGQRIGSLFFNPGGPGASGTQSLPTVVADLGAETLDAFDVVSWDPRGVGASAPLTCERGGLDFYQEDLSSTHPGPEVDEAAKHWADLCEQESGNVLPFVGTRDVAIDLDLLRQAVGDEKLTYAGFSYGTLIGLVYAELFPTHIRAMILDGVVDPTLDPATSSVEQAVAIDAALGRFVDWCPQHRDECPLDDASKALDQVYAMAHDQPLPGSIDGNAVYLSPTLVNFAVVIATYDSQLWPTLAQALRDALAGDGAGLSDLANAYLGAASPSLNMAVSCLDSEQPTGDELQAMVDEAAAKAPRSGVYNANSGRPCEFWPVPPKPLPSTYDAAGSPPIMVWGTTGDNATPYENAVKIAGMLDDAELVTLDANRHGALGGNDCVQRLQSAYLVHLELPPDGTRC